MQDRPTAGAGWRPCGRGFVRGRRPAHSEWVGALGYYTHYQAPDFKLIQLGFRFYDPGIGRFTQQDPIKTGLNWYEYCYSNPLSWVDPGGDCPLLITGGIGAAIGGIVGGVGAYLNGDDIWTGIGRGAAIGGIAGLTGGLAGGLVGGGALIAGASNAAAGAIGGTVGGAVGSFTGQRWSQMFGWRDDLSWSEVGVSAALGGIGGGVGGALARPMRFTNQMANHMPATAQSGKSVFSESPNGYDWVRGTAWFGRMFGLWTKIKGGGTRVSVRYPITTGYNSAGYPVNGVTVQTRADCTCHGWPSGQ